jgi:hypothetical protein
MSSKREKKPSNLTYLHKNVQQSVKDGKASTLEEIVVDGPRGLSVKYFHKSGDKVDKIVIFEKNGEFTMKTGDEEKTLSKAELLEELKSNKKLKFAVEYAKTQKGGKDEKPEQPVQTGGAKKGSKKSSKKGSKKSSKKGSKKSSKKMVGGAKKGSKKSSKKGSKKSSKKVSKKSSKKGSKKSPKKMVGGAKKKSSKKGSKKGSKK